MEFPSCNLKFIAGAYRFPVTFSYPRDKITVLVEYRHVSGKLESDASRLAGGYFVEVVKAGLKLRVEFLPLLIALERKLAGDAGVAVQLDVSQTSSDVVNKTRCDFVDLIGLEIQTVETLTMSENLRSDAGQTICFQIDHGDSLQWMESSRQDFCDFISDEKQREKMAEADERVLLDVSNLIVDQHQKSESMLTPEGSVLKFCYIVADHDEFLKICLLRKIERLQVAPQNMQVD